MYPYHNRIKQRIKAGELVGFHFVTDYPRIGEALVLEFGRPPLRRPVRPYRWPEYKAILEQWRLEHECAAG